MVQRLARVPDRELVASVRRLVAKEHEVTLDLVERIAEVEARRLYADEACSSMFVWLTQRLGLEEGAAYRRLSAARVIARFPLARELYRRRKLGLTGLADLAKFLTTENHQDLLRAASGLSNRAIRDMIAERFPQPERPRRSGDSPSPSLLRVRSFPCRPLARRCASPSRSRVGP